MKWLTKHEHENYLLKNICKIITSIKKTYRIDAADLISLRYYTKISYQLNECFLHHGLRNKRVSRFEFNGQFHK